MYLTDKFNLLDMRSRFGEVVKLDVKSESAGRSLLGRNFASHQSERAKYFPDFRAR